MRRWSSWIGMVLVAAVGMSPARAQESLDAQGAGSMPDPGSVAVVEMDAVQVSGVQPGPGLWQVSRGDHVLYILGTQSPLPRDIQWQSDEVRQVLAEAGVVLGGPGVSVSADVGLLRGLTLVPAALRAQRNPDGATLDELLPPEVNARWSRLKARYLGRARGVEKKRPAIAAYELYRAALKEHGLRGGGVVQPVIDGLAKARGLEQVSIVLKVEVADPRKALAEFRGEAMRPQDLQCFVRTLDLVEHGLPQVARRAGAWSTGDLAALRAMPEAGSQVRACLEAWAQTDTARRRGFTDIEARVRERWLEAALAALAEHRVSFATLPIESLLYGHGGFVQGLEARGYVVSAPDQATSADDEVDVAEQADSQLPAAGPG